MPWLPDPLYAAANEVAISKYCVMCMAVSQGPGSGEFLHQYLRRLVDIAPDSYNWAIRKCFHGQTRTPLTID